MAREGGPADPSAPEPEGGDEWEWIEEEEEEEVFEEDQPIEVEQEAEEEPEFPDFPSPRTRRSKRERSDPPIPLRLVPRETRERIEISQEIFRARREVGVSRRPLVL